MAERIWLVERPHANERQYTHFHCAEWVAPLDDAARPERKRCDGCGVMLPVVLDFIEDAEETDRG